MLLGPLLIVVFTLYIEQALWCLANGLIVIYRMYNLVLLIIDGLSIVDTL